MVLNLHTKATTQTNIPTHNALIYFSEYCTLLTRVLCSREYEIISVLMNYSLTCVREKVFLGKYGYAFPPDKCTSINRNSATDTYNTYKARQKITENFKGTNHKSSDVFFLAKMMIWPSSKNYQTWSNVRCCPIEWCSDDFRMWADRIVRIARAILTKRNGIFPLDLADYNIFHKHVYDTCRK